MKSHKFSEVCLFVNSVEDLIPCKFLYKFSVQGATDQEITSLTICAPTILMFHCPRIICNLSKNLKKVDKLQKKDFDKKSKVVRITPMNSYNNRIPGVMSKHESGGLKKLKNTIKLKSKHFKDFPSAKDKITDKKKDFKTAKSFNALDLIDKCVKKDIQLKTVNSNNTKDRSLSQKLGVKIPIYKLSEPKSHSIFHSMQDYSQYQTRPMNSRKNPKRYSDVLKKPKCRYIYSNEPIVNPSNSKPSLKCIRALETSKAQKENPNCAKEISQIQMSPFILPMSPVPVTGVTRSMKIVMKNSKINRFMSVSSNKYSSQYSYKLKEEIKRSIQRNEQKEDHNKDTLKINTDLRESESKSSFVPYSKDDSLNEKLIHRSRPCNIKQSVGNDLKEEVKNDACNFNALKSNTSDSKIEVVLPQIGIASSRFTQAYNNKTQPLKVHSGSKINFKTHKIKNSTKSKNYQSSSSQSPLISLNSNLFNIQKPTKHLKHPIQSKNDCKRIYNDQVNISHNEEPIEGWAVEETDFPTDFL
ncbi:unnamed protein product [Moneuplotes crassus]|uniref:Uncharacterized protein n=1 Tax=Euplotes crassus TaxID=5936 RepID=A0AAD1X896_EUPCR|nr:unnamed protein product [Moneuplotes crassus]